MMGEWQEVQELLCNPLSAWKRNHLTVQIAEPKADRRAGTRYSQASTTGADYSTPKPAEWGDDQRYPSSGGEIL